MTKEENTKLLNHIKEVAARECLTDDPQFLICDYCGGNVDDAYAGGEQTGEILFARHLLEMMEEQS